MRHPPLFLAVSSALLLLAGCIPELATPDEFQDRVTSLRVDWDVACPAACGTPEAPAMRDYPADVTGCTLYSDDQAAACVLVMQKVVDDEICGATNQRMKNLGSLCAGVFSGCPVEEAEGGSDDA